MFLAPSLCLSPTNSCSELFVLSCFIDREMLYSWVALCPLACESRGGFQQEKTHLELDSSIVLTGWWLGRARKSELFIRER